MVHKMADAIVHRGPDGAGFYNCPQSGVCIGMRRLAIIDIANGDQPFHSADGKVHLVLNGEIYNHLDLRGELEVRGHRFRTHSDTEVALEAFLEWGDEAWQRLHGMFALAIIDERSARTRLLLVRDRVGIKPLYMARKAGRLAFASEIKALLVDPALSVNVNLEAVRDYLSLRYVPGRERCSRVSRSCPPAMN